MRFWAICLPSQQEDLGCLCHPPAGQYAVRGSSIFDSVSLMPSCIASIMLNSALICAAAGFTDYCKIGACMPAIFQQLNNNRSGKHWSCYWQVLSQQIALCTTPVKPIIIYPDGGWDHGAFSACFLVEFDFYVNGVSTASISFRMRHAQHKNAI